MKDAIQRLITGGLSENEAKIYLALLELGKGTVSEITRKANLNRTTGYDVLDGLVAKNLASVSGKEPKQEYAARSELGKGTVSEITRKANLNRTTGYDVLDGLVAKNLASVSGKEPKQEYAA